MRTRNLLLRSACPARRGWEGTVTELLHDYEAWLDAAGASQDTIKARVRAAKRLLTAAGTVNPCDLRPQHLVNILASVKARWSKATYYGHAVNFATWCEFAGMRVDFLAGVKRPKVPRGEARPIDAAVFRRALSCADELTQMMFLLASYAGLRVHEIARVHGRDIREGKLFVTGKGGSTAAIPLHPVLALHAREFPADDWWFPGERPGRPVTRGTVWRRMHKVLRAIGSDATPHMVRHLYGSTLLNSGNSMRATQTLLRHRSLSSTQIYTEVSDQHLQTAIERLPDFTAPPLPDSA